ncbi:MAG TPA: pantoate--beta-alanine ligase [Polyangiaceae bacterium]|nr:pantoate--beta-alanine ligase [Polyangiaceae bacterium]
MKVATTIAEYRALADALRGEGGGLGLVPTMGALHRGHLALVAEARRRTRHVALSIFVNPTQFGPNEDFQRYPRPLEQDLELCREAGVALVLAPEAAEMYPAGEQTRVHVSGLTDALCGPFRPGHFDGVATIVTKLFAATGPAVAVFGRKDYQQLQVVKRLARDLLLPIEVVGLATVRDPDGLALSSRNAYLAPAERERALAIPRGIAAALALHAAGERNAGKLRRAAEEPIAAAATRIDYVSVAEADELRPFADAEAVGERAVVAVAAFVGGTRLIDNAVFGEDNILLGPR